MTRLHHDQLPISDFSEFSNAKHQEVDDVDDNYFKGSFFFLALTVPQTIILSLVFYCIFRILFNYKISTFFRRYSFLGATIIQSLVETNIVFFSYIFFRQTLVSFSFNFNDKLFLALSVCLFFFIMIGSFCYYFIGNLIYEKKFGYFIHCFYRCFPTLLFLTFRFAFRGFAQGAIHSLLHNHYGCQILLLCLTDFFVILSGVVIQLKYEIFTSKTMYCLTLCYYFNFILFNIVIYCEEKTKNIPQY